MHIFLFIYLFVFNKEGKGIVRPLKTTSSFYSAHENTLEELYAERAAVGHQSGSRGKHVWLQSAPNAASYVHEFGSRILHQECKSSLLVILAHYFF